MSGNSIIHSADIVIIFVVLFFCLLGYSRGLVTEVLSMIGWLLGILVIVWIYPFAVDGMVDVIGNVLVANVVTAVLLFIATLALVSVGTKTIILLVKTSKFGMFDKSLGFVFGILKGAAIVILAYVGLMMVYPNKKPDWIANSASLPVLEHLGDFAYKHIPNIEKVRESFDTAEDNYNKHREKPKEIFEKYTPYEDKKKQEDLQEPDYDQIYEYEYEDPPALPQEEQNILRDLNPVIVEEPSGPSTYQEYIDPLFPEENIEIDQFLNQRHQFREQLPESFDAQEPQ